MYLKNYKVHDKIRETFINQWISSIRGFFIQGSDKGRMYTILTPCPVNILNGIQYIDYVPPQP